MKLIHKRVRIILIPEGSEDRIHSDRFLGKSKANQGLNRDAPRVAAFVEDFVTILGSYRASGIS